MLCAFGGSASIYFGLDFGVAVHGLFLGGPGNEGGLGLVRASALGAAGTGTDLLGLASRLFVFPRLFHLCTLTIGASLGSRLRGVPACGLVIIICAGGGSST